MSQTVGSRCLIKPYYRGATTPLEKSATLKDRPSKEVAQLAGTDMGPKTEAIELLTNWQQPSDA